MKIKIKGSQWTCEFVDSINNGKALGMTILKERKIYVDINQTTIDLANSIAHELLHAYAYECAFRFKTKRTEEDFAHFIGINFQEMQENFNKILKRRK